MCSEDEYLMVALFFDSGRIEDIFYGATIFEKIVEGNEISNNQRKIVISLGDILDKDSYQDISPYVIKNQYCSIDFEQQNSYTNLKDWPFCWIIEDVERDIIMQIDKRLKKNLGGYLGMSQIDTESTDSRKQFWKSLIRDFSIESKTIIVFRMEEEGFGFSDLAKKYRYNVNFDENFDTNFDDDSELPNTRKSSFIKLYDDLEIKTGKNDSDRGIQEMNFSLVKEVGIAGEFIWKSIEDISKFNFSFIKHFPLDTTILFLTLYQASQGIERLQKIVAQLLVYKKKSSSIEREQVDKLLYSHKHFILHNWITKERKTDNISKKSINLLNILQKFYNEARYSRYSASYDKQPELTLFKEFSKSCNKDNLDVDVKHEYGKSIYELSAFYYDLIRELAHELKIFVYELYSQSAAQIVFCSSDTKDLFEDLNRFNKAKKELIYWLQIKGTTILPSDIELHIEPLDFDSAVIDEYVNELIKNKNSSFELFDQVSYFYDVLVQEDKKLWLQRIDLIEQLIGNSNIFYEDEY